MSDQPTSTDDVVLDVRSMLGMGATREQIAQHLTDDHPEHAASLDALLTVARAGMLEDAAGSIAWHLACSLQRHRDLYQRAMHIQDWTACLKIETAIERIVAKLAVQDSPA